MAEHRWTTRWWPRAPRALLVAGSLAALLATGLPAGRLLPVAETPAAAEVVTPAAEPEPAEVVVFGEAVSHADGVLVLRLPPPQSDTRPDGSVVESRVMLPGLDDVSGQLLPVSIGADTTLELLVAEPALIEAGSPLLVAGVLDGTVLAADFVVDTRSPGMSPEALPPATADDPELGPDAAALPLWALQPGDGPDPSTLPACSETGPSPMPCRADFAGELGLDLGWRSPDWNQEFFNVGLVKASFNGLELMYKFGADYDFRFAFDAVADPPLAIDEDGSVEVTVDPLAAPESFATYDAGLYVGVDFHFTFCAFNPLPWVWDWACTPYRHSIGFGFRNEATGPPPMAGQTLDTEPSSCLGFDMLDFLPRSVIGVGTAGIEFCLGLTIKGADLGFQARAGGGPATWLTYPGGPVAVHPTDRTVPMELRSFTYEPTVDVDFTIDVYLFGWRESLATFDYTDAEFHAVPTYQDDCPIMDLFPLNFLVMFTTGCGDQIGSIPFDRTARSGRLEVALSESGAAAPGRTYSVFVDGPGDVDVTVDLADGGTWMSPWLPLGQYTVSEVDPPAGVSYAPSATVDLVDGAVVPVAIGNDYSAGRLSIGLSEIGSGAPGSTYTLEVDGPGDADQTIQLADGQEWTSSWLPLGDYEVREVDPPTGVTYSPSETVTLSEDGATVPVEVVNDWSAGRLALHLEETGAAAPGRTYTVRVVGPGETELTVQLADGDSWTSSWLPLGEYTVAEVDPPAGVAYSPSATVELGVDGTTLDVRITNAYGDTEVLDETIPGPLPRTGAGVAVLALGLALMGSGLFVLAFRGRRPRPLHAPAR